MTKEELRAHLPPPIFKEYAYTVLLPSSDGWAGSYSAGPMKQGDSKERVSDDRLVKAGQGIEGRITGGLVEAWDYGQAQEKIHALHDRTEKKKDKDGNEIEVTVVCIIRTMEPRDMR